MKFLLVLLFGLVGVSLVGATSAGVMERIFHKMDTEEPTGEITLGELWGYHGGKPTNPALIQQIENKFHRADKDGSGTLNLAEYIQLA